MTSHLGLVLHVQAGNGSPWGWFNNPKSQASSTWWVSKTGRVEQYVDANVIAWAQAAGNTMYNSVETEGFPSEPLTPQQVSALAELYAWGVRTYRWNLALANTPGTHGFGYHAMGGVAWGGHPLCPGTLRIAQREPILNAAALILNPPKPQPPTPTPTPTHRNGDDDMFCYRVGTDNTKVYQVVGGSTPILFSISHVSAEGVRGQGGIYYQATQEEHDAYVQTFVHGARLVP
jgi:hypothetical protein